MNVAHLHLLLNHFPVIGTAIGIALLLAGRARKNNDLSLASLALLFIMGLFTIPTYLSGSAAQGALADTAGLSADLIVQHQDAAVLAFAGMMGISVFAWLGLWQWRRHSRPAGWTLTAALVMAIVTLGLMANAAAMGGAIRHPEIVSGSPMVIELSPGLGKFLADAVIEHGWAWPALETLHFIGLALLAGVVLPVNLRMLGLMKRVPFAALHTLLPWAILGFAINAVSGMLFFITAPDQYTGNPAFYWKILFIGLAGAHLLYLTVFDEVWAVGAGDDAPLRSKMAAASAVILWFGVIGWGRLMPFLGLRF